MMHVITFNLSQRRVTEMNIDYVISREAVRYLISVRMRTTKITSCLGGIFHGRNSNVHRHSL